MEPLLHEWQVYESGTDNFEKARAIFLENKGSYFLIVLFNMETAAKMKSRVSRMHV